MRIYNEPLSADCAPKESQIPSVSFSPSSYSVEIREAESLCKTRPRDPENYLNLAKMFRRQGLYRESGEACAAGLILEPFDGRFHYEKGIAYMKQERISEAAAAFTLAGRFNKGSFAAHIARGIAQTMLGQGEQSEDAYYWAAECAKNDEQRFLLADWHLTSLMISGRAREKASVLRTIPKTMDIEDCIDSAQLCSLYRGMLAAATVVSYFANKNIDEEERSSSTGLLGCAIYMINTANTSEGYSLLRDCAERKNYSLAAIAARQLYICQPEKWT